MPEGDAGVLPAEMKRIIDVESTMGGLLRKVDGILINSTIRGLRKVDPGTCEERGSRDRDS